MNKIEFIAEFADKHGVTKKEADKVFATLSEMAKEHLALKGSGAFIIPGVGNLVRVETAARNGRNPSTGETMTIPAGHRVKLKVGASLKALLKA